MTYTARTAAKRQKATAPIALSPTKKSNNQSCPARRPAAPARKERKSRSISRVLSRTVIPLGRTSLYASSNLPGSSAGHAQGTLFGLAPGGVYLATHCYQPCGALLPHLFTLTGKPRGTPNLLRRLFSAALSVGSHPPGITWHLALWSPDFPPPPAAKTSRRQRLSNRLSE